MNQTAYTINVRAEDCTSVVMRVLGLMQRRRLDFQQFEVNRRDSMNGMYLSMEVCCSADVLTKVKKKIEQIIDVWEVASAPLREALSVELEPVHLSAPVSKVATAGSVQSMTMR